MLTYYLILMFVTIAFPTTYIIWMIKQIPRLQKAQGKFFDELLLSLGKRGFKADRIIKVHLPSSRFYLNPNWIPAVYCFLFVDEKNQKWTLSFNKERDPKIYDFSDFRSVDLEVNGKPAGNAGLNALIAAFIVGGFGAGIGPSIKTSHGTIHTYSSGGSVIGGLLGAGLAAALTRRYGLIKRIKMKIRMKTTDDNILTLPIITAPLRGLKDTDKGLEFVMSFISQMNDAFQYISSNS